MGETDIRGLNQIILKEPFWTEPITLIPGQYKTEPNNVRTATGEIFEFASPSETPMRMHGLVGWLQAALSGSKLHPIEVAAKLHYDFVLIHPFDDGNGRVARLLLNYVLLRAGFTPLIVKSADKTRYLTALRKADAGDLPALTAYLGGNWNGRCGSAFARQRGNRSRSGAMWRRNSPFSFVISSGLSDDPGKPCLNFTI
jgi:fido (protein-threonine AMPylation protein)